MDEIVNFIIYQSESYLVISIVIICLIVGFVLKNYTKLYNGYIPLVMMGLGIVLNTLIAMREVPAIDYTIILSGAFSGLTSCGLYDVIAKSLGLVKKKLKDNHDDDDDKNNNNNSSCCGC